MNLQPECCFCSEVFGSWKALAEHLVETPCGRRKIGERRLVGTGNNRGTYLKPTSVICWCGRKFNFTYRKMRNDCTAWEAHMIEVGGLPKHILELALGVPNA